LILALTSGSSVPSLFYQVRISYDSEKGHVQFPGLDHLAPDARVNVPADSTAVPDATVFTRKAGATSVTVKLVVMNPNGPEEVVGERS
jgi:hypothetical protein